MATCVDRAMKLPVQFAVGELVLDRSASRQIAAAARIPSCCGGLEVDPKFENLRRIGRVEGQYKVPAARADGDESLEFQALEGFSQRNVAEAEL